MISPDVSSLLDQQNCTPDQLERTTFYDDSKNQVIVSTLPVLLLLFSIFALTINIIFAFMVIIGLRSKKLPFKGYSLLLNRSITDVLTCIFTLLFVALHSVTQGIEPFPTIAGTQNTKPVSEMDYLIPNGRTLFTLLLTINFWAAAGCYAVLALFTFFAVRHPMFYIVKITDRITVMIMLGVWVGGVVFSIIVTSLSSNNAFNVFNSASDLVQWSVTNEDFVLSIANLFIVMSSFVIVSTSYIAIIFYLWRKSIVEGGVGQHIVAFARLSLNVAAFALSCIIMAIFVSIPLFLRSSIRNLDEMTSDEVCEEIVDIFKLSYSMSQWSTVAMVAWQFRMILDPAANILLDARFQSIWTAFCGKWWPKYLRSTNQLSTDSIASEFLRKMVRNNVVPRSVLVPDGHFFRFRSATDAQPSTTTEQNNAEVHQKASKEVKEEKAKKQTVRRFDHKIAEMKT